MRRGEIYATAGRGDFSNKPRPSLVVQNDAFNAAHPAVTVCPITSHVTGDNFYRVPIRADERTNLFDDSEVEIDLIQAIKRPRFGRRIGMASDDTMILVDEALRRWLAL